MTKKHFLHITLTAFLTVGISLWCMACDLHEQSIKQEIVTTPFVGVWETLIYKEGNEVDSPCVYIIQYEFTGEAFYRKKTKKTLDNEGYLVESKVEEDVGGFFEYNESEKKIYFLVEDKEEREEESYEFLPENRLKIGNEIYIYYVEG